MAITEYEDKIKQLVDDQRHEEFIYDFLAIYDKISKATITKLRKGSNNLSKEAGEVHLKNKLFFKETDDDLLQVYSNVEDKMDELKAKPRYIIVTDYQKLLAKDTRTNDTLDIEFKDLPKYFDFFLAWNGIEKADFEKENPADLKAAERFAKLFDEILKNNENIERHGLNLFLIRVLFCLFAEDTGIFEQDIFTNFIKSMTKEDGSDMNERISELFSFLDKKSRVDKTPTYLTNFPYVNGQLFTEPHTELNFTSKTRDLIIEAGELIGWAKVNPDILGSMLQAVATEDKRSHLGMHYTSVPNIMKVIKPLFLDDLRAEFENAKGKIDKLNRLLVRIGKIKFMDPACGSGNFLIITYKELRRLEMDILGELNKINSDTMYVPVVTLGQFYGIEIEDFAVDVTRLSLWIADHQMNRELEERFHDFVRPTLPLQKSGDIYCGNALRVNWEDILPHEKEDEVYLFGNPPYLGARKQTKVQKEDLVSVFGDKKKGIKNLDYISGWFMKGMNYITNTNSRYAFVTTNSVCQGEQVSILWPEIFKKYGEITFAYQSFKWGNNAKNNAGVTVNIIGLDDKRYFCEGNKKLYIRDKIFEVKNISPYLCDTDNVVIYSLDRRQDKLPDISFGSMPNDGGHLILSEEEYDKLSDDIKKFCKKFIGASEFINGGMRYCLWLLNEDYLDYENIQFIRERISLVKKYRSESKRNATQKLAAIPQIFGEVRWKPTNSIIIPSASSENRLYVPMGFLSSEYVISNAAMAIYDAPIWLLGLLESRMHMVWLRNIGGKLKTDYRYSAGLVYNTFPVPELSTRRKNEIEELVLDILDIREEEGGTLADLYGSPLAEKNPKPMNPRLLEAHQKLDKVVERAYKKDREFKDDNERLAVLLDMYNKKVNG